MTPPHQPSTHWATPACSERARQARRAALNCTGTGTGVGVGRPERGARDQSPYAAPVTGRNGRPQDAAQAANTSRLCGGQRPGAGRLVDAVTHSAYGQDAPSTVAVC